MTIQILLVDDEPHVIRLMRLKLEQHGFQVNTASNGEDALNKIRLSPPDILLTDIQMPKMTGEQLCKTIQKELPDREFLIILLTSRPEMEHRTWSKGINNLWFYEKPISMRQLITQLEKYCSCYQ